MGFEGKPEHIKDLILRANDDKGAVKELSEVGKRRRRKEKEGEWISEKKQRIVNERREENEKQIEAITKKHKLEKKEISEEFGFSEEKLNDLSEQAQTVFWERLGELTSMESKNLAEYDNENIEAAWSRALLNEQGII